MHLVQNCCSNLADLKYFRYFLLSTNILYVQCCEKVFAPFLFIFICFSYFKQIIKQILILHKDNASKYKTQLLNDLIY